MAGPAIGTLDWIERTGGKLGWRDRLTIMAAAVRATRAPRASGRAIEAVRHLETDEILPPDSAICKAAEALSFEASER